MARRWISGTVIGLCIVCAVAAGWFVGRMSAGAARNPVQKDKILGQAPSYHGLTNQLNHRVDSEQFQGKVRVVTFLFTYCETYCPLITAHLVGFENLLRSVGLEDRVQLVAFNVDPGDTGPRQMRAFLKQYGWNPEDTHWQFLTGEPDTIRHIVTGGFHIAYARVNEDKEGGENPEGPEQTPQPTVVNTLARKAGVDYDISHNDGLIVVDPQGRIRKIYNQADMVSKQQLLRQVQALLPDTGSQRAG